MSDGQSVMEGERVLINQVNPFLRSFVVLVEMRFEKQFRQNLLNKVYLESTVDVRVSYICFFFFCFLTLVNFFYPQSPPRTLTITVPG